MNESNQYHFNLHLKHVNIQLPKARLMALPPWPHYAFTEEHVLFDRNDLENVASGPIAPYFGEWFKPFDSYNCLVRMPMPPLLLVDNVLSINAEPNSMGKGVIVTQTTVRHGSWYLHHQHMPAGIMIESGQADLLLISWLGIDKYNQGERVYRLLGCDITYYKDLPKVDDSLVYTITIDGHAKHGDIRLFFFHSQCTINSEIVLEVNNGQAGFFSAEELANSDGVLWDLEKESIPELSKLFISSIKHPKSSLSCTDLKLLIDGDIAQCFGEEYADTYAHTRSPNIPPFMLFQEVSYIDAKGGPWGRGYVKAIQKVQANDWYFQGHFYQDPCMPGTLMFEAGLQLFSLYMIHQGLTLKRDAWRFVPVLGETFNLRCRGQVIPSSEEVCYELFVEQLVEELVPTLYGHLLVTVDGLKAFYMRFGLSLIPDWPLSKTHPDYDGYKEQVDVARNGPLSFNYYAMLACALGKQSEAFGAEFSVFDTGKRAPRLPAPPYHFISRVNEVDDTAMQMKPGTKMMCSYDVPNDAWYFEQHRAPIMPFCVFIEMELQPCGWLGSYVGSPFCTNEELLFRNLEGEAVFYQAITPNTGTVTTTVQLTEVANIGNMLIESFHVHSYQAASLLFEMKTKFGYFPESTFDNQKGTPIPVSEATVLTDKSDFHVVLADYKPDTESPRLNLSKERILMLDAITGFWPKGGKCHLGRVRGQKKVTSAEWFFKAHFFQDPVQPGSLGLQAMIELIKFYMLQQGMGKNWKDAYFDTILNNKASWKYRGQVTLKNQCIITVMDVIEQKETEDECYVLADTALWVDGLRIYETNHFGVRIIKS